MNLFNFYYIDLVLVFSLFFFINVKRRRVIRFVNWIELKLISLIKFNVLLLFIIMVGQNIIIFYLEVRVKLHNKISLQLNLYADILVCKIHLYPCHFQCQLLSYSLYTWNWCILNLMSSRSKEEFTLSLWKNAGCLGSTGIIYSHNDTVVLFFKF